MRRLSSLISNSCKLLGDGSLSGDSDLYWDIVTLPLDLLEQVPIYGNRKLALTFFPFESRGA